jgi:hypothetical protein
MQRETPYLSVAAADVEWIASERAAIERFVDGGKDVRVLCFMHMLDAVLAFYAGDDERATRHWHDLLAISSERDFGLLWIDALENRVGAARARPRRRTCRVRRDRRKALLSYRYPHLAGLPSGSDAVALSSERPPRTRRARAAGAPGEWARLLTGSKSPSPSPPG